MQTNKMVTKEHFDVIHMLNSSGLTNRQIVEVTGRGRSTVSFILRYDTFDVYKEARRKQKEGRVRQPVAKTYTVELTQDEMQILVDIAARIK